MRDPLPSCNFCCAVRAAPGAPGKSPNAPAFNPSAAARYVSESDGLKVWDFGTQARHMLRIVTSVKRGGKSKLIGRSKLSVVMRAGEFDKGEVARVDILPGQR